METGEEACHVILHILMGVILHRYKHEDRLTFSMKIPEKVYYLGLTSFLLLTRNRIT